MITSLIRAIPGWISFHVSEFLKLLRSRTLSPPHTEFIHLVNPVPVKPDMRRGRNGRPR